MNLLENISYNSSAEQVKSSLIQMKKSLDEYKLSDKAVPKFVEQREKTLAIITNHFIMADELITQLSEMLLEAKKEGFRQGVEQTKKQENNIERFGTHMYPVFDKEKEKARKHSINKLAEQWPELL